MNRVYLNMNFIKETIHDILICLNFKLSKVRIKKLSQQFLKNSYTNYFKIKPH
jgi:hypothetical protein